MNKHCHFWSLSVILNINLALIALAMLWGIYKEEPSMKFEEYGFITLFSSFQLFITGIINFLNLKKSKHVIWGFIGMGFLYLALDELFLIHEHLDIWINAILNLQPTPFTDRIDDFIILFYGITGITLLALNYKVFVTNKPALWFLYVGFVLMVCMVIVDTLSNDTLVLSESLVTADIQHQISVIIEESLKVISEGFLLAGFYSYYRQ